MLRGWRGQAWECGSWQQTQIAVQAVRFLGEHGGGELAGVNGVWPGGEASKQQGGTSVEGPFPVQARFGGKALPGQPGGAFGDLVAPGPEGLKRLPVMGMSGEAMGGGSLPDAIQPAEGLFSAGLVEQPEGKVCAQIELSGGGCGGILQIGSGEVFAQFGVVTFQIAAQDKGKVFPEAGFFGPQPLEFGFGQLLPLLEEGLGSEEIVELSAGQVIEDVEGCGRIVVGMCRLTPFETVLASNTCERLSPSACQKI